MSSSGFSGVFKTSIFLFYLIVGINLRAQSEVAASVSTYQEIKNWMEVRAPEIALIKTQGIPAIQRLREHYLRRLNLMLDDLIEREVKVPSPIVINLDFQDTLFEILLHAIQSEESTFGIYRDPFYRGHLGLIFSEAARRSGDLSATAAKARVQTAFNYVLASIVSGRRIDSLSLPDDIEVELRKRSILPSEAPELWQYGLLLPEDQIPETADPRYLEKGLKKLFEEGRLELADLVARLLGKIDQDSLRTFSKQTDAEKIRIIIMFINSHPQRSGAFFKLVYPKEGQPPVHQSEISLLFKRLQNIFFETLDACLPSNRRLLLEKVEITARSTRKSDSVETTIVSVAYFKSWIESYLGDHLQLDESQREDLIELANESLKFLHRGARIIGGKNYFSGAPEFYQITSVFYQLLVEHWDQDERRAGLLEKVLARAKFPPHATSAKKREIAIETLSVLYPFYLLGACSSEVEAVLGRPEISDMMLDFLHANRGLFWSGDQFGGMLLNASVLLGQDSYNEKLAKKLDPKKEDAFWFYTLLLDSDWTDDELIVAAIVENSDWELTPQAVRNDRSLKTELAALSLQNSGLTSREFAKRHRKFRGINLKPAFWRGLHTMTARILRDTYLESIESEEPSEAAIDAWRQKRADQVANLLEQSFRSLPDFRYEFSIPQSIVEAIRKSIWEGSMDVERALIPDHPTHDFTIYCIREHLRMLNTRKAQAIGPYWDGVFAKLRNLGPGIARDANRMKVSMTPTNPKVCRQLMLELTLPAPRLP
ncbi:MAG: hypothetical protein COV44_03785 [Deltaproteobacteria bacterium CG11_big_fil_rev_8_21_14_0_20_45_16]|nr:MAG: hypothetical protein COV44_03785 [Deltaproteobacteria bacterium CG11_big_fil_rev_8_21_14_0_20_45_16]